MLKDLVVGSLTNIVRPWWQRAWQRLWHREPQVDAGAELPDLSEDQIPLIRRAVLHCEVRADLPDEQANALAETVISTLTSHADDAAPSERGRAGRRP